MFEKRSFHDHDEKMRTSGLQLCSTEWENYCSEACADKKKTPELTCQCKHPECIGDIGLKM